MSDNLEEELFDVFDEPQANRFHQVKLGLVRDVMRMFDDDCNHELASAVDDLEEPRMPLRPEDPPEDASDFDKAYWKHGIECYVKTTSAIEWNLPSLYGIVYNRCAVAMKVALESHPDFKAMEEKSDGIALLKVIKTLSYSYRSGIHPVVAAHDAALKFFTFVQGPDMSLDEYMEEFEKRWEVLETVGGGGIAQLPYLQGKTTSKKKGAPPEGQSEEDVTKSFLAAAFIRQADPARFGSLQVEMNNDYVMGRDTYPRTVFGSYQVLTSWTPPGGGSEYDRRGVKCFLCQQRGHYRNECPMKGRR